MQIIMALNGGGVRRSVKQIDALLNQWRSCAHSMASKRPKASGAYQAFVTGSIRHSASAAQEDYVWEHFVAHVRAVVGQRTLAPGNEATLISAISTLETVYQADSTKHEEEERDAIGIGAGYAAVTAKAKQAWDEYRRAWVEMINTLSFPTMTSAEATQAIETLLTVERVDELKNNILGIR